MGFLQWDQWLYSNQLAVFQAKSPPQQTGKGEK
jgi:hypothetical protein